MVRNLSANTGDMGSIPGQEDPLKQEMATHSNILAWEIPCTEATVHGVTRVRHDLTTKQYPNIARNYSVFHFLSLPVLDNFLSKEVYYL